MPHMRSSVTGAVVLLLAVAGCGSSSPKAAQAPTTADRPTTSTTTAHSPGAITLKSEPGVTPVELQRAETLIENTIRDLKRFQTPAQAYAAGYRSIGDRITGDEHYVNWSYANDGHLLD